MDIKSKNNKRISLLIAAVIAALFAAGLMSQYGNFEKKADMYYKDSLQSDNFLKQLYWSNYIFYKDIREKTDKMSYSYEALYLDIAETPAEEIQMEDYTGYMDYRSAESLITDIKNEVENMFAVWEDSVMNQTAQEMDYCVIDQETGEIIKNTGKNIEALAKPGESEEKAELPYVYYVGITYDSAGNPERVTAKGKNSDELLKSVQRVMKNSWIQMGQDFMGSYGLASAADSFYAYNEFAGKAEKITYRTGVPKNVTFVYALTQEQKDKLTGTVWNGGGMFNSWWDEEYAYFQAGVIESFMVLLCILTVVILLLIHSKRYCLHQLKSARIPVEISIAAGIFIFGILGESVVGLVNYTNRGYFNYLYSSYLPFLPTESYRFLTAAVNFIFLSLLFGVWIYLINTVGEITTLGIKQFFRERSIAVKGISRMGSWCRGRWNQFRDELLHVNLGAEMSSTVHKVVFVNFAVLAVICCLWVFGWIGLILYSILLYLLLKKYIKKIQDQYSRLLEATGSIAEGNLNTAIDEDLGIFESYKEELYRIQEGFRKAVDEEVKSQRMKTELITNVSHDLKTPLTAICTYIDLLKEDDVTEEQRKEYLAVLEKKSLRLKTLIEDLFEVSKANSKNVTVNFIDVDLGNLMRQVYLEYEDRVKEANLTFRFRIPEEKLVLRLDSEKTYRIFENLYINIIKYAMPGSRVYVDVEPEERNIRIELKNMSAVELNVAPEELTERFVRGDSSRNTEGSGLGLAIANSFTQLQGGRMEVTVDGDLFKVTLWLPWKEKENIEILPEKNVREGQETAADKK